ncbi:MAG TPA: hypothetical protein VGC18_13660, partial [Lacisediminihabitans sp.]|uniref:RHS repeat domain-containing protein n=1 Tax=Lacisediminihabitans sp. TaxID=2787631 RepID=UPI002ED99C3E
MSRHFTIGVSRRVLAVTASIAIVTSGFLASPAFASAGFPAPHLGTKVPGKSAAPLAAPTHPKSSVSVVPQHTALPSDSSTITIPAGGTQAVPTTSDKRGGTAARVTGGWRQLGSTGIEFARAGDLLKPTDPKSSLTSSSQAVGSVNASLLSVQEAKADGLKGLVIRVARADGKTTAAPLAIRIPKELLSSVYGGDYASRVRWAQVAAPKKPSTTFMKKASTTPVASVPSSQGVVLTPQISSNQMLLVPMSAPVSSSGTGSFAATPLKPSSTWDVSAQTGDFSWSYAMRTPPAAAGPTPTLALQYDSQSVDGETASTNNQPSSVGEGWDVSGGGYIERTYVGCSQDNGPGGAITSSGDLCWKTDNATISVAGHSGQLVKDATTGVWKLQSDDGSRIEHLVGTAQGCSASNGTDDDDCWRMTSVDGTQYYFGLNQLPGWSNGKAVTNSAWTVPVFGNDPGEPCHASAFAASACMQAWRWNLDYVVDPHGNAEALYYNAETNKYARDGGTAVTYTRGGQLNHIDYGLTTSSIYATNAASDRVVFGYDVDGRCSDASQANCTSEPSSGLAAAAAHSPFYPDVPFDQLCTGTTCPNQLSPTFWTTGMLDTVTTQYLTAGAYAKVDTWTLGHSFPNPGDGTNASLWLTGVTHTGYSGSTSLSEPPTLFVGATMNNRVWAIDGLAPLAKYRITSIHESLGAITTVNYADADCTTSNAASIEAAPQSNTNRCYPEWWTPDTVYPQPAQEDLFNKYIVTSVISDPHTGGGNDLEQETDYVYTGAPAWRYDVSPFTPDAHRTWSVFAGYSQVQVRVGSAATPSKQQTTEYTFYQGLDGDRAAPSGGVKRVSVTGSPGVPDSLWFAGQTRDTKILNGVGGAVVSDSVTTPSASAVTANDGVIAARMVHVGDVMTTEPVSTGGSRTTETVSTFDPTYGLPLTVNTITSDAGATCTTTSYTTPNTNGWLIDYPKEVSEVGVDCTHLASAVYPAAAISDSRTSYDAQAWGAAPTRGDATQVQIVDSYAGVTAASANWATSARSAYDSMGRATSTTDVLGHTTTTAYTPSASAPAGSGALTQQVVTNTAPFGWTSSTAINPAWGVETAATDQNGNVTTATYDALGRRSQVWLPIHPQATNPTAPSISYAYTESTTSPNAIKTSTLGAVTVVPTYALFDGLGRQVQTQAPSEATGSMISDTAYDMAGRVAATNSIYWTTSVSPSATLFVPTSESQVPSETVTNYDGAGRPIATILNSLGVERYRTVTAYLGADRIDVTPPSGGTPTSTFTNTLAQTTKLVQYLAAVPAATATQEATTYSYDPQGQMTGMSDPAGNHWAWSFDVLGHQVRAVDPDTGTTTSTYDDAGERLSSTDGRGQTLSYSYDALGRKTAEYVGANSTSGSLLASWTFDSPAKGQLSSSHSYVGSAPGVAGLDYATTITGYNAAYQPTASKVSIPSGAPAFGGTTYTTQDTYNWDGSLATQTDPAEGGLSAELLRYSYTGLNDFSGVRGSSALLASTIYTGIDQVATYDRLGTTEAESGYSYDAATGAVTAIQQSVLTGVTLTTPLTIAYHRDDAGDVTSQSTTSDSAATDTQCYTYDHLQELTAAWTPSNNDCTTPAPTSPLGGPAPYRTSFVVDPATGNRLSATQTPATGSATTDTYSYPAAGAASPHAVQSVAHTVATTDSYGYDGAGDTTARPGQLLTYDAAGRLSTVTAGGATQSNVYDADGNLLLQSDATNGSTLLLGDTELHVATGSATVSAVRTYSVNGTPYAERDTKPGASGSVLNWLLTDAQNTVVAEINTTTAVLTRRYTDPYGNGRGTQPASWSSDHGFLNAPTSALSDLTLLGAREYDPGLGRFLSVDSVLAP